MKYPIAPHLENPEVCSRIAEALDKRDQADYECFKMLKTLLDVLPNDQLVKLYASSNLLSFEEANELISFCHEIVKQRQDANEDFLRALSGRP